MKPLPPPPLTEQQVEINLDKLDLFVRMLAMYLAWAQSVPEIMVECEE